MDYVCDRFDISLSGPGGAYQLGNDEAEKLIIDRIGPQAGHAFILLRDNSRVRAQLSALYEYQTASSSRHGQNTIQVRDRKSGDLVLTCREVAFANQGANCFKLHVGKIEPI